MSLVSSNPQDLAQEMDDYLEQGWSCPPDAQRMMAQAVKLLRATPQASSAERSEEDLVSAIAESLRDFQVSAGGMLLSLTETERRRIGWTVRGVCRQVVRDGP